MAPTEEIFQHCCQIFNPKLRLPNRPLKVSQILFYSPYQVHILVIELTALLALSSLDIILIHKDIHLHKPKKDAMLKIKAI